jgi:hypothetical protein
MTSPLSLLKIPSGGLDFDYRDPKMGVFLQSEEATPCGHLLTWTLTPCGHHVHGHGSPVKNRWRFSKFCKKKKKKNTKLWPSLSKSVFCKKMWIKSSHWSCLKAWFKGHTFCFTIFLVRPSTGAQQRHGRAPKKPSYDLERSKFRQEAQGFVCVPPWRRVTFKFWEMLKNASEVTLVPKKIFFSLKILNFVQSFMECKASLADGK